MITLKIPTGRNNPEDLNVQIDMVANNPIADSLMNTVSGMLAILNQNHQVVSINETFLTSLGVDDPAIILGLKPGETLDCVHATEGEHGCGSSAHCQSCGAAIALVTSLAQDGPVERICALTSIKEGIQKDLALRVRSQPLLIEGQRFILLFLQDITRQEQRAALERSFHHDLNNTLMGLS